MAAPSHRPPYPTDMTDAEGAIHQEVFPEHTGLPGVSEAKYPVQALAFAPFDWVAMSQGFCRLIGHPYEALVGKSEARRHRDARDARARDQVRARQAVVSNRMGARGLRGQVDSMRAPARVSPPRSGRPGHRARRIFR